MNRPYVFCHMMCALDGKIMGGYMRTPQGRAAGDAFYDIAFGKESFYHHQGWLSGRVTTDDNFTFTGSRTWTKMRRPFRQVISSRSRTSECSMSPWTLTAS